MAIKNYNVSIQTKDNTNIRALVGLVQNDTDSNVINVQIIDDLIPLDFSDYTILSVNVKRPDDSDVVLAVGDNVEVIDAETGKLKITLPLSCVQLSGVYNLSISINKGTTRLTTALITYNVLPDILETSNPVDDSNYPVLQGIITQASQVLEAISTIQDTIDDKLDELDESEAARVEAEEARADAEEIREENESDRIEAENARDDAELDRANAEDVREANESERQTAESQRNTAEGLREAAEQARASSESDREDAEDARQLAETTRDSNEDSRIAAEAARVAAESARVTAENLRAAAESARELFEEYDSDTTYVEGNKVAYNGSSYVCLTSVTGENPDTSSKWLLIAKKGDKGDQGDQGNTGSAATISSNKVGKTTTLTIIDNNGTTTATILDGADGQGSGDMLASIYDTHNKAQDIFAYVDNHVDSALTARVTQAESDIDDLESDLADTNTNVTNIQSVIPAEATSSNVLADKNFVNSSINSSTAFYRGSFNTLAELQAYSGPLTNNDYAYVKETDSLGQEYVDRYKYNSSTQEWALEYKINNTTFTAAQLAAINSGVTAPYVLPAATTSELGGIVVGSGLSISSSNKLNLKNCSTSTIGGCKPDGTTITSTDGVLSAVIPDQVQVINNLTSTSTTAALSAYQGKLLNDSLFKFWSGTEAQYNALSTKDADTFYFILDA